MARQNYRVYAYIGPNSRQLTRILSVLDTGAGSSFIRKPILPDYLLQKVQPFLAKSNVRDASNSRVRIFGTVTLVIKLGLRSQTIKFKVVENLGTDVIIGCD